MWLTVRLRAFSFTQLCTARIFFCFAFKLRFLRLASGNGVLPLTDLILNCLRLV